MHDDVSALNRLQGPEGEGLEARLALSGQGEREMPRFVAELRRRWPRELVGLALRLQEAKDRQARKFPADEPLRFTPELLEQASAHPPAAHRAARLAPFGPVLDLGCGAGGDLSRLARAGAEVIGLEADPLSAALADANLKASGLAGAVIAGRFPDLPLPAHRALFVDPARRDGERRGRRIRSMADFSPSPATLPPLLRAAEAWALKWGPALDLDHATLSAEQGPLAGLSPDDYELELVSWNGELREAVFWGGDARRGEPRKATSLQGPVSDYATHEYAGDPGAPPADPVLECEWVHEPDPALIRSGLLNAFARERGLAPLAPGIAYLGGSAPRPGPFLRAWRVVEHLGFGLRALQEALDRQGAGSIVLKKRGFPLDPESLRSRLRLEGDRSLTVLIYRDRGQTDPRREHRVCLCEER